MGDCKNNMKTTVEKDSDKKGDSVFGKLIPRKKKDTDKGSAAETYADNIAKAYKKMEELIIQKTSELASEKGEELNNSLKLGNFRNQLMHLDAIVDLMNDYEDIK